MTLTRKKGYFIMKESKHLENIVFLFYIRDRKLSM